MRLAVRLCGVALGLLLAIAAIIMLTAGQAADRSAKFLNALDSSIWRRPLEGIRRLEYSEPSGLALIAFRLDESRPGEAGLVAKVIAARDPKGETAVDILKATGAVLVINGGYFDKAPDGTLSPTGLLVTAGHTIAPQSACRACSGVLSIETGKNLPSITWAKSFVLGPTFESAVQTGPLLVEPGGKVGITSTGGPLAERSAICWTKTKPAKLVVVAVTSQVTLYEFAGLLRSGFCDDVAINLDGGPSTQIATTVSGRLETFGNISPVQNFVAFFALK